MKRIRNLRFNRKIFATVLVFLVAFFAIYFDRFIPNAQTAIVAGLLFLSASLIVLRKYEAPKNIRFLIKLAGSTMAIVTIALVIIFLTDEKLVVASVLSDPATALTVIIFALIGPAIALSAPSKKTLSALEAANAAIQKEKERAEEAETQKKQAEDSIAELEKERDDVKSDLANAQNEKERAENEKEQAENESRQAANRTNQAEIRATKAESEAKTANDRADDMERRALEAEARATEAETGAGEALLSEVLSTRDSLGSAYDSFIELRNLLSDLASIEDEYGGIVGSAGQKYVRDIENILHANISENRKIRKALKDMLEKNNASFGDLTATIKAAEERAEAAEAEVLVANGRAEEAETRATEAETRATNAENEIQVANDRATTAETRAANAEKDAQATTSLLNRAVTVKEIDPKTAVVSVEEAQPVSILVCVAVFQGDRHVKNISRVISAGKTEADEAIAKPEGITLRAAPVKEFGLNLDAALAKHGLTEAHAYFVQ